MSLTKNKITLIFGFLICILFIIYNSVYTVQEGQVSLVPSNHVKKEPLQNAVLYQPGLHFKLPFIAQSIQIDMRLHSFSFTKSSILTSDNQPLVLDYYANWRITNPALYYAQTQNDAQKTQRRLTQTINTLLEKECAHNTLNSIIATDQAILNTLLAQANKQITSLGITLVGIGFKSIDFPTEANTALLKSRRAEQARLALEQRAIGKANAENIRAKANNQAALLLAKTKEETAIIRGQADAQAAKIYSNAYHKNPQFAAFYLHLEAYRKGFTQSAASNNFLVINSKDGFFNLAKGTPPQTSKALG